MANMSYCRFTNTLPDFQDCCDAFDDFDGLSDTERKAALAMLNTAKELVENYEYLTE